MFQYVRQYPELRLSLLYGFVSVAWIMFSSALLPDLLPLDLLPVVETVKGLGFVVVTATGLFLLLHREFSQRRDIEARLRQSDARYQTIFYRAGEPIIIFDPQTATMLDCNDIARETPGYAEGDYSQMLLVDPPDDTPQMTLSELLLQLPPDAHRQFEVTTTESDVRNRRIFSVMAGGTMLDARPVIITVWHDITDLRRIERALRESELRFRTIHDRLPLGMITLQDDGTLIDVNPAFCEMLGYTAVELAGRNDYAMLHPDDVEPARASLSQLFQGDIKQHQIEKRYLSKHGDVIHTIHSASLIRDDVGQPCCVIDMVQDITGHKQAEDAIRESGEIFRAIFEQSPLGIAVVTLDYRFVQVNKRLETMLGYREADLRGRRTFEYMHGYVPSVTADEPESRTLQDTFHQLEEEFVRHDGSIVWINTSASVIRNQQGEPRYILQLFEDISQRKQTELQLREHQQYLSQVIEAIPDAMLVKNNDGTYALVNSAFSAILGKSSDNIIGQTDYTLAREIDDYETFYQTDQHVLEYGETLEYEQTIMHELDRRQYIYHIRKTPLRTDSGRKRQILAIARDVTARRQAEDALRRSEERFRAVFSQAADSIVLMEIHTGAILEFNESACRTLGYTPEEFQLLKLPDIEARHNPAAILTIRDEIVREGEKQFDTRHRSRTGEILDISVRARVIHAGGDAFILEIWRDVTQRKDAERALRRSVRQFRTLFEQSPAGIVLTDLDGTVRDVNRAFSQITGYTRDEFIEYFSPETVLNSAEQESMDRLIAAEEAVIRTESLYQHREGRPLWLSITASAVVDEHNQPDYLMVMVTDITERKQLEAQRDQNIRSLELLHQIDRAILAAHSIKEIATSTIRGILDLTGCQVVAIWQYADDEMVELVARDSTIPLTYGSLTRVSIEDAIGEEMQAFWQGSSVLYPDLKDRAYDLAAQQQMVESGIQSHLRMPLVVQGDVTGSLNISYTEAGNPAAPYMDLLRGIASQLAVAIQQARLNETVRRANEQLKDLLRRVVAVQETERRFIARELHDEIGQLLTGLKISLGVVRNLPAEQIKAAMAESLSLVDDLMTKVRAMSLDLRPSMLDDLGLLPALLWQFKRYTEQTGVRVNFRQTGLENRLNDELELAIFRVIQESLTNVARYAEVDQVTVILSCDENTIQLIIEDEGRGFDLPSVIHTHGSVGLAGMRERVIGPGGDFRIESAPGEGTRIQAIWQSGDSEEASHD